MNKHTIIVIIASIIIAGSLGFSFWNVFAAEQIQIKSVNDNFSFFDLMNNGRVLVCNPLPLDGNFKEIKISMVYNERSIGFLSYPQVFLDANSEETIVGRFVSENVKEFQYNALHFDGMYNGVIPSRIDTQNMLIVTEINTSIIGFIPYSIYKYYPGLQFWDLMNNQNNQYDCEV
jgi:hypothetical protein